MRFRCWKLEVEAGFAAGLVAFCYVVSYLLSLSHRFMQFAGVVTVTVVVFALALAAVSSMSFADNFFICQVATHYLAPSLLLLNFTA